MDQIPASVLPRLLTPEELAGETGLNKRTSLGLARQGILPCVRVGRRVLFDRDVVLQWMRSGGQAYPGGWRKEPAP